MNLALEIPAYDIALEDGLLRALGEIVVILGQVDDDMTRSLTGVLGISRDAANRLMRTQDAIDLWASFMRGRVEHEDYDAAISLAASEVKAVQRDRNDFIHADYSQAFEFQGNWVRVRGVGRGIASDPGSTVLATRSRDQRTREASEIAAIRNRAARASRLVAHVVHSVAPHGSWDSSPWYSSVEPFLAKAGKREAKATGEPVGILTLDGLRPVVGDDEG